MSQDSSSLASAPSPKVSGDNGLSRIARLRAQMERTTSESIRAEGKELRQAAEESLNVILDLDLSGHVRWVSPTWTEVVGSEVREVQGKPITDVIAENKDVFTDAVNVLRSQDSSSKVVRFAVAMGPKSRLRKHLQEASGGGEEDSVLQPEPPSESSLVNLEAQGILVYDRSTGEESHVS